MNTKIKRTAVVAALTITTALSLAAWSGGSGLDGIYQDNTGWEYLSSDGEAVTFIEPDRNTIEQAIEYIQSGELDSVPSSRV